MKKIVSVLLLQKKVGETMWVDSEAIGEEGV